MSHKTDHLNTILDKINVNGGYFLPAIQRKFVWSDKKIVALFDSIMRGYPIGTLLIWKTKENICQRKFTEIFTNDINPRTLFTEPNDKEKHLVLDGQQRLQALLIGLKGTYMEKVLCFDPLADANDPKLLKSDPPLRYKFEFIYPENPDYTKKITAKEMFAQSDTYELSEFCKAKYVAAGKTLTSEDEKRLLKCASTFTNYFRTTNLINYSLIDSINEPSKYTENDVIEIFVRTNNGGTKLEKSELLFALLTSDWDQAIFNIQDLIDALKLKNFELKQDFILKACLMMLDQGAAYKVSKFRDASVLEQIKGKWPQLREAMTKVVDFIPTNTPIENIELFNYKNSALPLIYFAFKHPQKWNSTANKTACAAFIEAMATSSVMSGSKDTLLDDLTQELKKDQDIDLPALIKICEENTGKVTAFSYSQLWTTSYKKKVKAFYLMKWINPELGFNSITPSNKLTIDHLVPQSQLRKIGVKQSEIDQFANLTALTSKQNSTEKKAKPLADYLDWLEENYKGEKALFINAHLIPELPSKWTPETYAKFIEDRKVLIMDKAKTLGVSASNTAPNPLSEDEDEEDNADS
ncbi:MAG: DUF262 domain-containing protein [Opitutales bacterium]|nr:DUF262 domain-containing protein [Opitutales bacterium]